jgi:hypothetical protein
MGGWLTWRGGTDLLNSKHLADHGEPVQADVVDSRERVSGRFRTHSYYLTIAFETPSGTPVRKEVKVSEKKFESVRPGGTVKAWYLAEQPAICAAGTTVDFRYSNLFYGLLAFAGAAFLWFTRNLRSTEEELAEKLEARLKPMMVEHFDYVPARAAEFGHLDLAFYDNGRQVLEKARYSFLSDEENVTIKMDAGERTFLRVLVGREQTTVAFLYHFKVRGAAGKDAKVLDLESWFSNGQFVVTSNAARAGMFDSPPAIHSLHLPDESSWDEILQAHNKQVSEYLEKNPAAEAVRLRNMEDVRRFQNELQRTKANYRRNTGLSKAELERFVRGRAGINVEELHAKLVERLHGPRLPQVSVS